MLCNSDLPAVCAFFFFLARSSKEQDLFRFRNDSIRFSIASAIFFFFEKLIPIRKSSSTAGDMSFATDQKTEIYESEIMHLLFN